MTYGKSKVRAVAEMDPLKDARSHGSAMTHLFWFGKRKNAPIRDVTTLD